MLQIINDLYLIVRNATKRTTVLAAHGRKGDEVKTVIGTNYKLNTRSIYTFKKHTGFPS